jgi:uncharacterized protein YneF (UPF0154 family)
MSEDIINVLFGIVIGLIIGYYLTLFGVAKEMSKNTTATETERTIIYTYSWERLKE